MAEKLTFDDMTWDVLEERYGVHVEDRDLFQDSAPFEPTPTLVEVLRRARRFRLTNERARAHRLVDPVLAEIELLYDGKITTVPEPYIEVRAVEGLAGNPDFVLSASLTKLVPLAAIVEAKKPDIDSAMPQCAAELYAAYLLNKGIPERIYGCVTIGTDWRFLCFDGKTKRIIRDPTTYFINELPRLLGIFRAMIDQLLSAFENARPEA